MESKIEQYRESFLEDVAPFDHETNYGNNRFRAGFDAAIALNLPVKFADWVAKAEQEGLIDSHAEEVWWISLEFGEKYNLAKHISTNELAKCWLENIYKPES